MCHHVTKHWIGFCVNLCSIMHEEKNVFNFTINSVFSFSLHTKKNICYLFVFVSQEESVYWKKQSYRVLSFFFFFFLKVHEGNGSSL